MEYTQALNGAWVRSKDHRRKAYGYQGGQAGGISKRLPTLFQHPLKQLRYCGLCNPKTLDVTSIKNFFFNVQNHAGRVGKKREQLKQND